MNTSKKQRKQPLPYDVIAQASEGNNEALDTNVINLVKKKHLHFDN